MLNGVDSDLIASMIVFVFGAMIGSFLNVCIVRLPNNESIVQPSSHCPGCKTPLRFYDNIPLISYLVLLGRCRSCRVRISARYFAVELLTALLAVALYRAFGLGLAFFAGLVFVAALIVVSFIDLAVRIVPDVISLPGIIIGLVFSILGTYVIDDPFELIPTPVSAFLGVIIGGGFLLLLAWLYEKFTGVEGMGGGDVKLLAMMGAFLGWPSIPLILFFASVGGSVVGLSAMLFRGVGRRYALPFAPFLCLGALFYVFFGKQVVAIYLFPSQ